MTLVVRRRTPRIVEKMPTVVVECCHLFKASLKHLHMMGRRGRCGVRPAPDWSTVEE